MVSCGCGAQQTIRSGATEIMASWAPSGLVALPGVWLVLALIGYASIFWAVTQHGVRTAVETSGSSLLTLGFVSPRGFAADMIAFSEAAVGVALLALVIAYLPTIYAAYSRRELVVAMLDARAGTPPSAIQLMLRHHRYGGLARLDQRWSEWEQWVVDIGQTHMTHPVLPFFRSPDPEHSWITAVGALLDAANLRLSAIALPGGGNADASIYLTAATRVVRDIAGYFQIVVSHDGEHKVTQVEFDAALDELAARRADRRGPQVDLGAIRRPTRPIPSLRSSGWRRLLMPHLPRGRATARRPSASRRSSDSADQLSRRPSWNGSLIDRRTRLPQLERGVIGIPRTAPRPDTIRSQRGEEESEVGSLPPVRPPNESQALSLRRPASRAGRGRTP